MLWLHHAYATVYLNDAMTDSNKMCQPHGVPAQCMIGWVEIQLIELPWYAANRLIEDLQLAANIKGPELLQSLLMNFTCQPVVETGTYLQVSTSSHILLHDIYTGYRPFPPEIFLVLATLSSRWILKHSTKWLQLTRSLYSSSCPPLSCQRISAEDHGKVC